MKLKRQDRIWNRAAMEAGGSAPAKGDAALAALLLIHGMAMNGGLDHALEALSKEEFTKGIEEDRFFGLSNVASILEKMRNAKEFEYDSLDKEYGLAVPNDSTLVRAFERKLLSSPEAFSPLEGTDA